MTPTDHTPPDQPALSADERRTGERLGQQLRKLYDEVISEQVPDEFMRLLEDADKPAPPPAPNDT